MYVGCVIYFIVLVLVSDFYSIFNQRWDSSVKNWLLSSWDISVKKSNNKDTITLDCDWKINVKMILNIFIHSVCCGIDCGHGGQVVAEAYWV